MVHVTFTARNDLRKQGNKDSDFIACSTSSLLAAVFLILAASLRKRSTIRSSLLAVVILQTIIYKVITLPATLCILHPSTPEPPCTNHFNKTPHHSHSPCPRPSEPRSSPPIDLVSRLSVHVSTPRAQHPKGYPSLPPPQTPQPPRRKLTTPPPFQHSAAHVCALTPCSRRARATTACSSS